MGEGKDGLLSGEPLALDRWQPFLDRITRAIEGAAGSVEVSSIDYGHQRLAENVAIRAISFDRRSSLLEIGLDGLDHRIAHPRSVSVDVRPEGLKALQVVGEDGIRTIIHLHEPLTLGSPQPTPSPQPRPMIEG